MKLLKSFQVLTLSCVCFSYLIKCHSDDGRGAFGTFVLEKVIEKIQSRMRYGFPLVGIGPLAPLRLNDRNNFINLSFMQFNSSLTNLLIDGIDRFHINYVNFSLRDKSMNFSLTFTDLKSNGSFYGFGNFIKYLPVRGKGNYTFDIYNFTTNILASLKFNRLQMQIANVTAIGTMSKFKSNVTGIHGDKRRVTKSIEKVLNRLIEVSVPRIFKFNQNLFNYTINNIVVPRLNRILSIFAVKLPSFSSFSSKKNETVILRQLDDKTIIKFLAENPITYPDDDRVWNMLLDDRFYDNKLLNQELSMTKRISIKKKNDKKKKK